MTSFRKYVVLVLFCLVWSVGPMPRRASCGDFQSRTIDIIGRGTIYRDDVARARDEAIADALQGVVEEGVALLISSASAVENFQLLSDRVYDQTEVFIHHYRVLTESKSGRYYRVVVRATVSMSTIRDKLQSVGILAIHKEIPTIMFLLSEQDIGEPSPQYWWGQSPLGTHVSLTENVFSEYMGDKGFVIVDRAALGRDIQLGPEYMRPELSDDDAVKLGKELGADVVIVGKAVACYSGNILDENMKSIQAAVFTRAIRTDSGAVIASSQGTRAALHSDDRPGGTEALMLSASVVAWDLVKQIAAKWRKDARQHVLVELVVKGIREYADFVGFRRHLKNDVRGIRNVYLRSIKAGEAKMDVDFMGNARILADNLMLQRFENIAVNIFQVSEKEVKLELIPTASDDH
ncbi:MAG: hypothetical protein KAV83_08325 [Desulfobacterales bacterium]|nr:hypothetical protein [Desulfobacterales bacterium]